MLNAKWCQMKSFENSTFGGVSKQKNFKLKQIGFSAEFSMTQCRFWNIGLEGMAVDL